MPACLRRSNARLLFLISFMLLYLLVGAFVFTLVEGPLEKKLVTKLKSAREKYLVSNACLTDEELEKFLIQVIHANNRGVSVVGNVTSEPNWSFGQSIFFAGTILTTIGYGHVAPLSEGGKIFCIVYALIGIPMTLIMFTAIVERLMILTANILTFLNRKLKHYIDAFHIRLVHLYIILTLLILFVFLIPAAIFYILEENWSYLDGIYYCFISMTTVGLGDYIPGDHPSQKHRALYKVLTTVYLFIGLILMMLVLANIYDIPEFNIGYHFYLKSDEEEDGEREHLNPSKSKAPNYTEEKRTPDDEIQDED